MQLSAHTQSARTAATTRVARSLSSCLLFTSVLVASLFTPALPLPLAQESSTESTTWFPCHLNYVVEDYYEEETSFGYALCTGADEATVGQSVIIPTVHDHEETEFVPNELVSVAVAGSASTAQPAVGSTSSVIHAGATHPLHVEADATTILANADVAIAAPARARRSTAEPVAEVTGLRSVLLLRVEYNGATPDYCDEECVRSSLESVDSVYQDMSNNKVRFPAWMAEIKTVSITNGQHGSSGCSYWNIAMEADQAARDAGLNPSDYQHTVYYLPREFDNSECTFGGLAFLGCTYPTCKVWLRNAYAPTLAHELGHNLNAKHSGTDENNDGKMDNQYGDNSDLMGFQKYWRGMNAPHLVELGWMPETAIKEVGAGCKAEASDFMTLSALGNAAATDLQVAVFARAAETNVDAEAGVGKYYLSYRAPQGVDELFATPNDAKKNKYSDKVFLHYTLDKLGVRQNTQLVKVMDAGDVYTDEASGVTITIIKINKAGAKADVHVSTCNGMVNDETTTTTTSTTTSTTTTTTSTTTTSTTTTTTTTSTTSTTTTSTTTSTTTTSTTTSSDEVSANNNCVTSMDRFGDAELDVRGIGGFTLQKPVDTESAEGCAAVCLANEACESFSYAGKTGACRIYKEDADTTDVPEVQESVHHIMDNHCLAQAAPIANGEIAITTTTTTTKSCARLNPFKARPKCGRSTDDNTQCCPGLKCAGKKDKHGIKTFRCAVDVPKKSVAPGGACTVTSQCSEFRGKCNTDHYICQSKQEWMAWKAGKAAQSRTRRVSTDEAMKNATATTATAGSAIVVGIIALACIVVAVIVFSIARTNTSQSVVDVSAGTFVTETPFSPTKHDMPTVLIMV